MENLKLILEEILSERLQEIRISNSKNQEVVKKIKIRPVLIKKELIFQESRYVGTKIYHENYQKGQMLKEILRILQQECKQLEAETRTENFTVLISKKNTVTIKRKKKMDENVCQINDLSHNRQKKYILDPNKPLGFLKDLGVQTQDGKIVKSKYDKFKQMNRYLEFVEDVLPILKGLNKEQITIIDFGCGKSYLTFALYYYLHEMHQLPVKLIGLDLKDDVIQTCSKLSKKYGYEDLNFIQGDIAKFEGENEVDMVVTLHACDTATDFALAKAMGWNAKIIFSVPCCQHEINKQMKSEEWEPIFKYGLLKERMAALITDGIRANVMEEHGYETQVMEFIDMEHTPKNILIRGIKNKQAKKGASYRDLVKKLAIRPTLMDIMSE